MQQLPLSLLRSPPAVPSTTALQQTVLGEISRCLAVLARSRQLRMRDPSVRFDLRGTMAGQARIDEHLLRFNNRLLCEHGSAFIRDTVPHEVAHLAAYRLHGRNIRPHGAEWRSVMHTLGAEPTRCHDYRVTPARRLQRYRYICACREHELTSIRHNRVRQGVKYLCTNCGRKLRPVRPRWIMNVLGERNAR